MNIDPNDLRMLMHREPEPTVDPEVTAAWPAPCPHCGMEWQRYGFMEWDLAFGLTVYRRRVARSW